jgi:hypothetical protein
MKKIRLLSLLLLLALFLPSAVSAASYSFRVPQTTVDVFWNADGSMSIGYVWVFNNDAGASPIDFIDVGLPNPNFDMSAIEASVDGKPITNIETSPYVTYGVALGLEGNAIPPGGTGTVKAFFPVVQAQLYPDDQTEGYVSAVFSPSYFDPQGARGQTDLKVVFHLPPGVQPDEPRWHSAPPGFPDTPETALDDQERIVYIWESTSASPSKEYIFGASFPAKYVDSSAVVQPGTTTSETTQPSTSAPLDTSTTFFGFLGSCISFLPTLICFGVVGLFIWTASASGKNRKLQYLPPSVSVEGHGIKRGLTAVEAAILLEQPVDKIMTMVLFSTIKKNAARVKKRDPLELEIIVPQPEDLREYEKDFLKAFALDKTNERRDALQSMMVSLVKDVAAKMKGFSRKETLAYYKDITERAWQQVEAADTPEVKSEKYDEVMDWTMLDKDYDDRTRRVFGPGPVYVPMWWPRYDPTFPRPAAAPTTSGPVSAPLSTGGGGGKLSLPSLPGSDFAASMVRGVQSFSGGLVGDLATFTGGITSKTNPIPITAAANKSTWSKSSGGGGTHCACACACACAGCACACAGGGR